MRWRSRGGRGGRGASGITRRSRRLWRLAGVVDADESLVHGRAKGSVRKVRWIKRKLGDEEERIGASCVRGK